MKKILFSDIDGTLVNGDQPISSKDQEAIKKLREKGHYFSFCTGRNIQETKIITPYFEYDYLVLNNGAMIVDQQDQVLYRKQIKNEIAKEILNESMQKYPYLNYTFFDGKQTYGFINEKTCKLTNVVYLDITVDCTKGTGLQKLCSLFKEDVTSYCIGDSFNDLDMFEKANHAYTFNRVEKEIKEKTKNQVDYVYEVIDAMLEGE